MSLDWLTVSRGPSRRLPLGQFPFSKHEETSPHNCVCAAGWQSILSINSKCRDQVLVELEWCLLKGSLKENWKAWTDLLHNILPLRGNPHKDSSCDAATFLCTPFWFFLTFHKLPDLNLGLSMASSTFISNMSLPQFCRQRHGDVLSKEISCTIIWCHSVFSSPKICDELPGLDVSWYLIWIAEV
jgi:hypothetical protein